MPLPATRPHGAAGRAGQRAQTLAAAAAPLPLRGQLGPPGQAAAHTSCSRTARPHPAAAEMEGDSSLAPIALLIDSLRSQDAAQRLSSVKRLKTISIALGAQGVCYACVLRL